MADIVATLDLNILGRPDDFSVEFLALQLFDGSSTLKDKANKSSSVYFLNEGDKQLLQVYLIQPNNQ